MMPERRFRGKVFEPPLPARPDFAQSASPSAKGKFSNGWKKNFPMVGKFRPIFPMIGKKFSAPAAGMRAGCRWGAARRVHKRGGEGEGAPSVESSRKQSIAVEGWR
jgi:hypothetical protein